MKKKLLTILIGCLVLSGCGAASTSEAASKNFGDSYAAEAATNDIMFAYEEDAVAEEAYDYSGSSDADISADASLGSMGVTFAKNKKIIYRSNVVLETKTYNQTYMQLVNLIDKYKGYIEYESYDNQKRSFLNTRSEEGNVIIATNNITIRIPSENYSTFMKEGLGLGNVLQRNQTIEDKTNEYNTNKSYVDILNDEAEYLAKQLNVLESELKQAQANDKHYDEIIENMKDIAERKAQVEKELVPYKSTMDDIDSLVEYSTISMELREVDEFTILEDSDEEPTFGTQLKQKWDNAMQSLANLLKNTLLFLVGIIPAVVYLLIITLVIFLIYLLVKKIRTSEAVKKYFDSRKSAKEKHIADKKAKNDAKKAAKLKKSDNSSTNEPPSTNETTAK